VSKFVIKDWLAFFLHFMLSFSSFIADRSIQTNGGYLFHHSVTCGRFSTKW